MEENIAKGQQEETTKEKGNALEQNVEFIFQSAGFETIRNKNIAKYEVDILAKIGDRKIVIECKNYQSSNLTVRNLIHQWSSKNNVIKANKVILVITGVDIKKSDRDLAHSFDIELWDESVLTELFNLSLKPTELQKQLLEKIAFKPVSISELYRDAIASLVIRPILAGVEENKENTFYFFNYWLRAFIRTNLQLEGTTKEERMKHIELFEGTKERTAFFKIFNSKRSELDYWNKLSERLRNEKILDKKVQKKYYNYMCELLEEYKNQKEYYATEDQEAQIRRLISNRLYDSLISEDYLCRFGFRGNQIVEVIPSKEGSFVIRVDGIIDKHANLINWILTSEYFFTQKQIDTVKNVHSWYSSSLAETAEKTYRILEEFFGYNDTDDLRDFAI